MFLLSEDKCPFRSEYVTKELNKETGLFFSYECKLIALFFSISRAFQILLLLLFIRADPNAVLLISYTV